MLVNYLKLSLRLLIRNPFFTFINVVGLSIGFAVFFILWQYSQSELRTDQFHKDSERMARLFLTVSSSSHDESFGALPPTFAPVIKAEVPEIEDFVRFISRHRFQEIIPDHDNYVYFSYLSENQDKHSFIEENVIYADQNFFQFFNYPLASGDPDKVLIDPHSIVVSASTARKYFGKEHPQGRILYLNDSIPFKVTGVFYDLPRNTSLVLDIVLSTNRIPDQVNNWYSKTNSTGIFFKYQKGRSLSDVENKINQVFEKKLQKQMKGFWLAEKYKASLMPLHDLVFSFKAASIPRSKFALTLLSVLSVIVLSMAWINYVNLSISMNIKRSKELAARKAVGARPSDFIKQFVAEAATINSLSFLLAISLVQLVKKPIETMFNFYIPVWNEDTPVSILIIASVLVTGVVLTGVYPAIVTARKTPKEIFGRNGMNKNNPVSAVLTVIQYTSAIALIVWVFSVSEQIKYILNKDMGITIDRVVAIDLPVSDQKIIKGNLDPFQDQANNLPGIIDLAISSTLPGDRNYNANGIMKDDSQDVHYVESNGGVNERFVPFYGIKLLAGRNFSGDNLSDHHSIIVSVNALSKIGFVDPLEALGKKILIESGGLNAAKKVEAEVIGIIQDYRRHPFYPENESVNKDGTILTYGNYLVEKNTVRKISVLIHSSGFKETMKALEQLYSAFFPGKIFSWYFLDDYFNRLYQAEKTLRNQIILFTVLAIGIACLGLLGVISNKALEKTKEIGIRKVLGAGLKNLCGVLLTNTFRQVLLSVIIGMPLAWYLTEQYLQEFSDRLTTEWWHYALPVLILLITMLATITSVLFKAMRTNPTESLRYE